MDEAQTHIRDLIFRAKEVLQSLDALDNNLITIGEIVTKESKVQNRQYGDVLAQVWTHLGGFQLEKKLHFNNLMLLRGLGGQRKQTVGQVQAALLKLTEFESEIGFLRERVVDASMEASDNNNNGPRTIKNPEDSGSKRLGTLSLKAHIQQIDQVTDRLKARSFLYDAVAEAQWNRVRSIEDGDE
ncbi:hypothetical protein BGZ76_001927 [Entomortierella beljakovae]|nr:hypothetical protein BGZ76_001927 [Entomortierella beljakovae]